MKLALSGKSESDPELMRLAKNAASKSGLNDAEINQAAEIILQSLSRLDASDRHHIERGIRQGSKSGRNAFFPS